MSELRPTEHQVGSFTWSATAPSGDAGNATHALDGALWAVLECIAATSSPAGTVEGKTASGVWMQIESYQLTSGTYTRRAAGATVTLATGDLLYMPGAGFTHVRFKRGSGTSMTCTLRTLESMTDQLFIRFLLAGIAVTITEPTVNNHFMVADTTNENLISNTARKVYGVQVFHIDATPVYVKLYDKATAPDENDTPVWGTGIPANATAANGGASNVIFAKPIALTNGLGIRAVTGITNTADGALTADECLINVQWGA